MRIPAEAEDTTTLIVMQEGPRPEPFLKALIWASTGLDVLHKARIWGQREYSSQRLSASFWTHSAYLHRPLPRVSPRTKLNSGQAWPWGPLLQGPSLQSRGWYWSAQNPEQQTHFRGIHPRRGFPEFKLLPPSDRRKKVLLGSMVNYQGHCSLVSHF